MQKLNVAGRGSFDVKDLGAGYRGLIVGVGDIRVGDLVEWGLFGVSDFYRVLDEPVGVGNGCWNFKGMLVGAGGKSVGSPRLLQIRNGKLSVLRDNFIYTDAAGGVRVIRGV